MRFKTSVLLSDLCDCNDAYIVVKGTNTVPDLNDANYDKKFALKFISWILKVNNTLIDNAEDSDIVMQMQNLIEYSKDYSKTSGNLWNYYRDETNIGREKNSVNYSI